MYYVLYQIEKFKILSVGIAKTNYLPYLCLPTATIHLANSKMYLVFINFVRIFCWGDFINNHYVIT